MMLASLRVLNSPHDVHALRDLAKDDMLACATPTSRHTYTAACHHTHQLRSTMSLHGEQRREPSWHRRRAPSHHPARVWRRCTGRTCVRKVNLISFAMFFGLQRMLPQMYISVGQMAEERSSL